jgi:hypothetical protein
MTALLARLGASPDGVQDAAHLRKALQAQLDQRGSAGLHQVRDLGTAGQVISSVYNSLLAQ